MNFENTRPVRTAMRMTLLAFSIRLLAIPLALLNINTYANHDAADFTIAARRIAHGSIPLTALDPMYVYNYWGFILSPFYLLPFGDILAHIFTAAIGSAAVWFVYNIAEHLHSKRAAVYATIPMVVFPSFVLIQTTLIREGPVLLLLTIVAYLLIVPSDRSLGRTSVAVAVCLLLAYFFRPENLPVYLLTIGVGVLLFEAQRRGIEFSTDHLPKYVNKYHLGGIAAIGIIGALVVGQYVLQHVIGPMRARRTRGGSAYLNSIIPDNLITAAWFYPIGVSYFLFAPFPWQVQSWVYLPAMAEGLCNFGLFIAALYGGRELLRRSPVIGIPLIMAFILFTSLYGLMEGNVGASIRHRQSLIWVLYLCGGIGLAEHFPLAVSTHDGQPTIRIARN